MSTNFNKGMPHAKITRIERNQNKTLWTWYFLKRELIAKNNKGNPNEMFLFHGSRVGTAPLHYFIINMSRCI